MDNILGAPAADPTVLKLPKSPCFRNANNGVDSTGKKTAFAFEDEKVENREEEKKETVEIKLDLIA